jgi:phage baseplate assembly protein W
MATDVNRKIGTGALFPINLTTITDEVTKKKIITWLPSNLGDVNLVNNNLSHIFIEAVGMRFRNELFGTTLYEALEEPYLASTLYTIRTAIYDAIIEYEPRVSRVEIEGFERSPGNLSFRVNAFIDGLVTPIVIPISYNLSDLQQQIQ